VGDVCDNCPDVYNPDQKDENQNGIGDVCERDTTSPTVTINHHPVLDIHPTTSITFNVIATDDTNVTRIVIYVNGNATECSPIEYFWKDNYWQCTWNAGRFPAGTLTYRAEAFDPAGNRGISAEKTLNVSGITLLPPRETPPGVTPEFQCFISGTIYDFKYYSKTLAVKACEAEVIEGGCLPTPPYTCLPPMTRCKEGGEVYYDTNLTRIWAGEERFRMPGPMEYHIYVPCNRSYLIQPVYQPYGDECQWQGSWRADKSNFVPATEPYAEDYDFYFEPMDLEGPSITQVIFPEDWDDLLSDEYFEIRVVGFDESGIKSIKLWLNVTTIGFISDESGPLEGVTEPVETLILNFSKECDASECTIRNDEDIEPLVCRPDDPRGCYCIFGCIDDLIDQIFRIGIDNVAKIKLNLKVKICDVAGNSVMNSYEKTYPHFGDLRIISAEPVQVVYGAPLVKGKGTAFRVKAESTFGRAIETKFRLILPDDQWGIVSSTGNYRIGLLPEKWQEMHNQTWGPIRIEPGINEIIVPIIPEWKKDESDASLGSIIRGRCIGGVCGPDVRIMPKPIADRVKFSVEVDPENEIRETNEANNVFNSSYYDVVTTKKFKVYYVTHIGPSGTQTRLITEDHVVKAVCVNRDDRLTRNLNVVISDIKKLAKDSTEYLLGVAPIADSKMYYAIDTTFRHPEDYGGSSDYMEEMIALAQSFGYDYLLTIEPCDCGGCCVVGSSGCNIGGLGKPPNAAHELLGHGILEFGEECYDCKPSDCELEDGNLINCTAVACEACGASEGFWVNKWIRYEEGSKENKYPPGGDYAIITPLYYADAVGNVYERWQRLERPWRYDNNESLPGGYLDLIEEFESKEDPTVVLVRGLIYKNGSTELKPFTILENMTVNLETGEKGDYYIVLVDAQ